MRAVITVIGNNRVGIIAAVSQELAQQNVDILDITQTILLTDMFTMTLLVETTHCKLPFGDLADRLSDLGKGMGLSIHAQREDTFDAMHRI
ncbi:MAG: ACT domain-containing protein [Bacillota bacterium]|nr:ACT domain-containing protein [Bacillota bacterium]